MKVFAETNLHPGGRLLVIFPGSILVVIRTLLLIAGLVTFLPVILGLTYIGCRKTALVVLKVGVRLLLWLCGFWWIRTSGERPKIPEEGCVIVANHLGAVDVLYMIYDFAPAFVSGKCIEEAPVISAVAKDLLDCIFIEQGAQSSGHTKKIIDYFDPDQPRYRRLCIFPEGTTTNGSSVCSFKTGAFLPKVPVIPVVFSMPFCKGWQCDPHYSLASTAPYFFGLMSSFANPMHVQYLPIQHYDPDMTVKERSQKIRADIADAIDASLVDFTYKDKIALMEEMNQPAGDSSDFGS